MSEQYQFPTFADFEAYVAAVASAFKIKFGQPMGYEIVPAAGGQTLYANVWTPYYHDGKGTMETFRIGFTNANTVPVTAAVDTINMTLAYAMQNDMRSIENPNPTFNMLSPVS